MTYFVDIHVRMYIVAHAYLALRKINRFVYRWRNNRTLLLSMKQQPALFLSPAITGRVSSQFSVQMLRTVIYFVSNVFPEDF